MLESGGLEERWVGRCATCPPTSRPTQLDFKGSTSRDEDADRICAERRKPTLGRASRVPAARLGGARMPGVRCCAGGFASRRGEADGRGEMETMQPLQERRRMREGKTLLLAAVGVCSRGDGNGNVGEGGRSTCQCWEKASRCSALGPAPGLSGRMKRTHPCPAACLDRILAWKGHGSHRGRTEVP